MSNKLQWFRLYHRIIDDEKLRLLAFEDRWHFIAVCCLKADGLLDEPESALKWRKVAVKLGVQLRELDEIKRRLCEVGLVDDDLQPTAWDDLQYKSDNSTARVQRYREKTKGSAAPKRHETTRNVSVTGQETEAETETEAAVAARPGDLLDKLLDAAGIKGNPTPQLAFPGEIIGLMQAGYDLDADILPAIRARPKPAARSWGYFVPQIREAAERKRSAASVQRPAPKTVDWAERLTAFHEDGTWTPAWGPRPGDPGCYAERDMGDQRAAS